MLAMSLTATAFAYLAAALAVLAPKKAGYSHLKHTISEIGEVGAPRQRFVAYGLFLPIGLTLVVVASLAYSASPDAATLALCIAVGYIGGAFFPCDPGSPASGSARQAVHNLAGAIEYIGGGVTLITIGETLGRPFRTSGLFVLGAAAALTVLPSTSVRGIIQRVAETCLFGGLAASLWWTTGI